MAKLEELELSVRGMTCDACAAHVTQALHGVTGVKEAEVLDWRAARATVVAEEDVTAEALSAAVSQAGYTATVKTRKSVADGATPGLSEPSSLKVKGDDQYDLMVIGAGSAGFAAAIKGAEMGYKVAMVGAGTIGGTCVNIGCVPSKTLIRAVELYHLAGQHRFQGVHTTPGQIYWPAVINQKDELVNELRQTKYIDVLKGYTGVTYIQGFAKLTGKNGVEVEGETYTPDRIIITTGAKSWAPPIPGLDQVDCLDSTTALDLKERPGSMVVLGANAVGLELAQIYARAGTYVTVLELMPHIAPFEEETISTSLVEYLEQEGIRIVPGFKTTRVDKREGRYQLTGEKNGATVSFDAEQLLVATGRRPNTDGMGLAAAGVELGKRGEIVVNEHLQTTNPHVYAAGDVIGRDMFVYVAAYAGGLAAENALTAANKIYDTSYIPRVTFTDPQIASAGLTEAQAREQGHEVKVSVLPMAQVPRAQAARDRRGFIKLVADAHSDRLLGAHILAPEAGEMIQIAVLAIRFGITVKDLTETMFPYLTNVEGLKLATLAFEKDVALLSCCAG